MKITSFLPKVEKSKLSEASLPAWDRAPRAHWGLVFEREGGFFVKDMTSKKIPGALELIEAGPQVWKELKSVEKKLFKAKTTHLKPSSKLTLLCPLPRPASLRDFLAFEEHSNWHWKKRGGTLPPEWYEMPVYYKGNHRTMFGPGDTIPWPSFTQKMDYELEIAMVVGKKGINIPKEKAKDYIFGYSILNDWSARDIQAKEMLCRLGPAKGKDFATSMGPWIVTTDELHDSNGLGMRAFINDETWSEGNSSTRHWAFEDMIAHVSRDEAIYPGDIYGSGTVGKGCGLELDRWIKSGDKVRLEIEGIGTLENVVGKGSQ